MNLFSRQRLTMLSFILVAGTGDCGWNSQRQPFLVTSLQGQDQDYSLHLDAVPRDWQDVIHTYKFSLGSVPSNSSDFDHLRKRVTSERDVSLPFDWTLRSNQLKLYLDPNQYDSVTFDCDPCATRGSFKLSATIEKEFGIPTRADLSLTASKVSATLTPKMAISISASAKSKIFDVTLAEIPIDAVIISGVLHIGPEFKVTSSLDFSGVKVIGSVSGSIVASIPDGSSVSLDVLPHLLTFGQHRPLVSSHGWDYTVATAPVQVSAEISGTITTALKPKLAFLAEILGTT
jgi:hypothetical protein